MEAGQIIVQQGLPALGALLLLSGSASLCKAEEGVSLSVIVVAHPRLQLPCVGAAAGSRRLSTSVRSPG